MKAWISELLTTVEGVKTTEELESACIADDLIAQDQSGSEKIVTTHTREDQSLTTLPRC